jgi:sortase A
MTGQSWLRWIERGLLTSGVALTAWCALILLEARFYNSLQVPAPAPLTITQTLPGDAGTPGAHGPVVAAPPQGAVVGRLEVPSIHLSTTVLEGSDDATLSRASGHIEDTPFPGQPGNVGIAGHRDTVFRPLRYVHLGDTLVLTTSNRIYRYRIRKTFIVGPDDVYVLDPTEHPTLTLVTCYPFEFVGHAPQRFIVQADLIGEDTRTSP